MIFLLVFWLLVVGAVAIGWQAGDRADRLAIIYIIVAAAASSLMHGALEPPVSLMATGAIDLALLVALTRYALVTPRFWPIWFVGFHATGMLFGWLGFMMPSEFGTTAGVISGFWSIPALFALVAGLVIDQQHGPTKT